MKTLGSTVIKPCTPCRPSPFQDSLYGPQNRVHNIGKGKTAGNMDKLNDKICTCCGKRTGL